MDKRIRERIEEEAKRKVKEGVKRVKGKSCEKVKWQRFQPKEQ